MPDLSHPAAASSAGLMMEQPLLISSILSHARDWHAESPVSSRQPDGSVLRSTWGQIAGRAAQLASALLAIGVQTGERVGTLAWNSDRHLALYYAVPGIGAVLHTVNPRLYPDQIGYILAHAEDRIVFLDPALLPLAARLGPQLPGVRRWVVLCDAAELALAAARADEVDPGAPAPAEAPRLGVSPVAALSGLQDFESFVAGHAPLEDWPALPETAAAGLCYTSGTTGQPKGVLYSHRSTLLHAMAIGQPDALAISARDTVLPVVPMFHVNAWGTPYACGMAGAALVLPGSRLDGDSLFDLMDSEGVSFSLGVPTVWLGLLEALRQRGRRPARLTRLMVGGSACPPALAAAYIEEFGIEVLQGWGMTETSPIISISRPRHGTPAAALPTLHHSQGRPLFGAEVKVVDGGGQALPHDGQSAGDLLVRGHWVASTYYRAAESPLREGWFPTGDVAHIDGEGLIRITDRSKDVIKSGGEWISSIQLENAALQHPDVLEAAAIGLPHPRWGERPLLLVVARPGTAPEAATVLAAIATQVQRWMLPDDVIFVSSLPHTATGKLSKLTLRAQYRDYRFPDVTSD